MYDYSVHVSICNTLKGIMLEIQMGRAKRIWYLSPMRAAKVQASLRIRAVSPEPPLLAHTSSESGGTFRRKARSLALLNGWACAVKICHDGMLEDTNSLDGAQMINDFCSIHPAHKQHERLPGTHCEFACFSPLSIALMTIEKVLHSKFKYKLPQPQRKCSKSCSPKL